MGYSRVTRVGPHVSATGTIALDDEGHPVKGDSSAQTRRVLAILERALRRVGATPDDVMRTRIFVTDIARDWEAVGRAHGEVFGVLRPATTMIEVSALIEPWATVEIEVDAILGGSPVRDAPEVTIHGADDSALAPLREAAGLPPADPEAAIWIAMARVLRRRCARPSAARTALARRAAQPSPVADRGVAGTPALVSPDGEHTTNIV